VKGVHDNKPLLKQVEHVVNEVVNDDELINDANCIFLKERSTQNVEGDESASNSSLEEKFVLSQNEGLNEPQ
jgi:hypothetical protein